MGTNSFYCSKCKKNTLHIEISAEEYLALKVVSGKQLLAERLLSKLGAYKLINTLQGHNYWKCSKCLSPTERDLAGKDVWNK